MRNLFVGNYYRRHKNRQYYDVLVGPGALAEGGGRGGCRAGCGGGGRDGGGEDIENNGTAALDDEELRCICLMNVYIWEPVLFQ
ncbi:hypothetical protein PIB30_102848 [Stylosanthes scabra]|uniref:Uncharacterized protein n=1 Tax=Stylosanthes scabra TaxID=79078 RepID=A0ABU6TXA2_9FABA|nr:hypothetical protein [Stylosanthes scabra]